MSSMGRSAWRSVLAKASSMGVIPERASTTNRMRSAEAMANSASVVTASEKDSSTPSPIPPVSTNSQGVSGREPGAAMRSRVTPG